MARSKIQARVSDELLERLDRMAREEERPRSQLIAVLLADALDMREFGGSFSVPSDEDRERFATQLAGAAPVPREAVDEPLTSRMVGETPIKDTYDRQIEWAEKADVIAEQMDKTEPKTEGTVTFHPAEPKRHYHSYGPETFIAEARPDKGVRMATYKCSCGRVAKQPLDEWNREQVDRT